MGKLHEQCPDGQGRQPDISAEASSHYHRGLLHENGWRTPRDMSKAVQCFRKAAEMGHTGAQYALGWAYAEARGVKKDVEQARRWWRQAAEGGHADAMYRLADLQMEADGTGHDQAEAEGWLAEAAAQHTAKPAIPLQVTGNGVTYVDPAALLDCPKVRNQLDVFRRALRSIPVAQPG